MNTSGLEWFGPPERNTLRPLCVVLLVFPSSRESPRELVVCSERLPFISQERRVHGRWVPRQVDPIDVALNNILFIHYGDADEGDLTPGFPCLLLESPVQHNQVLSCRIGTRRS